MNTNDKIQIQIETDEAVLGFKKDSEWAIKQILSSSPIIEATQPTSSASRAAEYLQTLIDGMELSSIPIQKSELKALKCLLTASAIVPQVVQAPTDDEPLSWPDEVAHLLKMQVAAPIVATVPSEPVAWMVESCGEIAFHKQRLPFAANWTPLYAAPSPTEQASDVPVYLDNDALPMIVNSHHYTADNVRSLIDFHKSVEAGDADAVDRLRNQDMPTQSGILWRILSALSSECPIAAPSDEHMANIFAVVRNSAIDECIAVCVAEEDYLRKLKEWMAVAACSTIANKVKDLKSATPADKGNAPAEVKGNQS